MTALSRLTASVALTALLAISASAICLPGGDEANEAEKQPEKNASEEATIHALSAKISRLLDLVEKQQQSIELLEKRIGELETGRSVSVTAAPAARPAGAASSPASGNRNVEATASESTNPPVQQGTAGWSNGHAFIRSEDGSFETRITGYAQLDYRGYQSGNHPPNTFVMRRVRLAAEGKVAKYFEFKVQGDFADTRGAVLRDGYLNFKRRSAIQLRFGQFKEPISQDELRGGHVLDFVERAMPASLVPSRSPGIMVHGSIERGVMEYQVGAFNGNGVLGAATTNSPEVAARLRFAPWKNGGDFWLKGLAFGGAVTRGRTRNTVSVAGQTESRSFQFFRPVPVNGDVTRANAEMTWLLGPAALRAEFVQLNQERKDLGGDGVNLPGVVAKAYMAQFTYLLTGEEKPDTAMVVPRRSLFGEGGNAGSGAWELKLRYSNLQITDASPGSNRAETFHFGVNWYLNSYVRHVLDLGFERFKDPLRSPRPGDRGFFVLLSRIQVAF